MQWEILTSQHQERTYALIFETGDEVVSRLTEFAKEVGMTAAHFTAIGAFSSVTLAYFDWHERKYHRIPIEEQVEALMVAGDIAMKDERPQVHAHAIVGFHDGNTRGGHLINALVRPTLELILTESPRYLQRVYDRRVGQSLIDLDRVPGERYPGKKTA